MIGDYLGYATTFVGTGLISGAVVHHPLDPDRYTVIALVGAAVFLCATLLNEFILKRQRPSASKVVAIVLASLALSFGIGMLSGGMQHFEDFPERAAMLIPFGLALSFVAYVLRYDPARWRNIIGPTGLLVLVTAAVAFVGLRGIAADMAAESGGGGHSHGEETTSATGNGEDRRRSYAGQPHRGRRNDGARGLTQRRKHRNRRRRGRRRSCGGRTRPLSRVARGRGPQQWTPAAAPGTRGAISTGPKFQSVVSPAVTASKRRRPAPESSPCFYAQTRAINSPDSRPDVILLPVAGWARSRGQFRHQARLWSCSVISGQVRGDDHTGALLRATLLVMVLAIFAMHALVSHQHVHSGHAAVFPLIDAGEKTQHSHADVTPGGATETPDSPDDEAPCDHGGAGESCLALLCIFAALLAFTLRHGGSNRVLYALRRWAAPKHPWISRTGDPPCIHQLSILRC